MFSALFPIRTAVSWSALLTAPATAEELASWNLTDETATAVTIYEGEDATLSLLIGATDESGSYYARLSGSAMICTVAADSVASLLEADAVDLMCDTPVPLAFEDLSEASFTLNRQCFTYQRTETEVTVAATEEAREATSIEVNVTLNGEAADAAAAESLWDLVSALTLSDSVEAAAEGDAMLSLRAANESGISASFEILEYNANRYLVVRSSGSAFLTPADSIDKLIRNLRQLG